MMYLKILREDETWQYLNVDHLSPGQIRVLSESIAQSPNTVRVELFDSLGVEPVEFSYAGGNIAESYEDKTPAQIESESYCTIPGDEG